MIKQDYAYTIKSLLTAEEVCRFYGIEVNNGKARCPFHHDKSPSMILYKGNKGWWCYPCNRGGSVIDLVMQLFNLSFRDAMAKLNDDFHLGLPLEAKPKSVEEYVAAAREAAERERREEERVRGDLEAECRKGAYLSRYLRASDAARKAEDPIALAAAKEAMLREAFLLAVADIKLAERRRSYDRDETRRAEDQGARRTSETHCRQGGGEGAL